MNNIHKLTLTIISLCMFFISCKKDIVDNPNLTDYETDLQQFEAVWNGINTAYALWPIDSTDWDVVYEHYYPIFKEMEGQSDSVWRMTWKELTCSLIDHHLNIYLERPSTKNRIELWPGLDEVLSRDYFHYVGNAAYYHYSMLTKLGLNGRFSDVQTDIDNESVFFSGVLDRDIAYLYISSFNCLLNTKESFIHFKQLVGNENIKAAIIDIRDNGGGIAHNIHYIVSCFSNEMETIGWTQTKTGLGRYELGPKLAYRVGAGVIINGVLLEGQDCDIPVVALTDIMSASASEIATIAIKQLPQGYVIGERSFGATCALGEDFGLFYSGSFGDSQVTNGLWMGHGHYVYTPKYLFTGVDGTVYEGHGIDPDVECLFDQSAWNNGADNQLECAVEFAKKKIAENGN